MAATVEYARKVRWGVLGCAGIARKAMIPALSMCNRGELYAVASRDRQKAEDWAGAYRAEEAYGSYEALLADKLVEAVYIGLPNSLHAEWTIKAAQAGKHVLCEKPLACDALEARDMAAACKQAGVHLLEGFMYRFHPRTAMVLQMLKDGKIGDLREIRGCFAFELKEPDNIRVKADLAGGALMDIGCYPVSYARLVVGKEPLRASAFMQIKRGTEQARHPVDLATFGMLQFPGDVVLQFSCRFDSNEGQWIELRGSKGYIRIDRPFAGGPGKLSVIHNDQHLDAPNANQFALQLDALNTAILDRLPITGVQCDVQDAINNMSAMDALYASALSGRTTDVMRM